MNPKYIGLASGIIVLVAVLLLWWRTSGGKPVGPAAEAPFKMKIDDVFALKVPNKVVVVGVISDGTLRTGSTLYVQTTAGPVATKVEGIETYIGGSDRPVKLGRAGKGDRVGIMLNGTTKGQVAPGDIMTDSPNAAAPVQEATASIPTTAAPVPSTAEIQSKFAAGQIWSYKTRPGEDASRITILKVEPYGKGRAVHVYISDVVLKDPAAPTGKSTSVGHMPFAEEAVEQSVIAMVATGQPPPAFEQGYSLWKQQADQGKAGVFTIPISEAVSGIETAFAKGHPEPE
jgi:hypothetical protein